MVIATIKLKSCRRRARVDQHRTGKSPQEPCPAPSKAPPYTAKSTGPNQATSTPTMPRLAAENQKLRDEMERKRWAVSHWEANVGRVVSSLEELHTSSKRRGYDRHRVWAAERRRVGNVLQEARVEKQRAIQRLRHETRRVRRTRTKSTERTLRGKRFVRAVSSASF